MIVTVFAVRAVPSVTLDAVNAVPSVVFVAVLSSVTTVAVGVPNVRTPSEIVADGIALLIVFTDLTVTDVFPVTFGIVTLVFPVTLGIVTLAFVTLEAVNAVPSVTLDAVALVHFKEGSEPTPVTFGIDLATHFNDGAVPALHAEIYVAVAASYVTDVGVFVVHAVISSAGIAVPAEALPMLNVVNTA